MRYVDPDGRTEIYFFYLYGTDDTYYQDIEIESIQEKLKFLDENNISYSVIKYSDCFSSNLSDIENTITLINNILLGTALQQYLKQ